MHRPLLDGFIWQANALLSSSPNPGSYVESRKRAEEGRCVSGVRISKGGDDGLLLSPMIAFALNVGSMDDAENERADATQGECRRR